MRRKRIMGLLLAAALMLLPGAAPADGFQNNLDGIDQAAKSVLMLEVFDAKNKVIGTGSGFVAFDSYTLVTNYHVIKNAAWILAVSDEGYEYLVTKVIAADKDKDIALLEFFSPTNIKPLQLATGGRLRRAAPVVAIGSPKGVTNTVSLGNISALYMEGGAEAIQFTAPVSPGSSGGALFDDDGKVIGITTAIMIDSQNMNLAVDIGEVIRLREAGLDNKRVSIPQQLERDKRPATPTPGVTAAPTPTPRPTSTPKPTPTATPTKAPTPSPAPAPKEFGLFAMWTEDGVVLRWEEVPKARYYEVYRWFDTGDKSEVIGRMEAGETYFVDTDASVGDKACTYSVVPMENEKDSLWRHAMFVDVVPEYPLRANLPAPGNLKTDAHEATVSWNGVAGADSYAVYRAEDVDLPYRMVGHVTAASFRDWGAKYGTRYYYKVRAISHAGYLSELSSQVAMRVMMPAPTPPADMSGEPENALVIGKLGNISSFGGFAMLRPDIDNVSAYKVVTGFSLAYYCQDADLQTVYHKETGLVYHIQQFDLAAGPGESIRPPFAWMVGYDGVKHINVAVRSVTYADGTTVTLPEDAWDFFYWTLE